MKNNLKSINFVGLILVFACAIVACNQDDMTSEEIAANSEVITAEQLQYSDEAEQMSDDIAEIAEDVYTLDELSVTSKGAYTSDYLPDCVTVTTVENETLKEKTIDFGEGCELKNGNILSGTIKMSYTRDMETISKTITVELENFTFNSAAIEGGVTIVRLRSNENGKPQSTATRNYNAIWPNGEEASFSGNRTREWIEGFGSGFWRDNVFSITGEGTFTNKAGNVWTKTITTPLRREMSCRFIVSGVMEISRNDALTNLDFGDGSCDAIGILTKPDGTTKEIRLRRFFKN